MSRDGELPTSFNNEFNLTTTQEIPPQKVAEVTQRFGDFYNLAPDIIDRGKNTRAYLINDHQFIAFNKQYVRDELEIASKLTAAHNKGPKNLEQMIESHLALEVQRVGGKFIHQKNGERKIFIMDRPNINSNSILDHEVLHALASQSFSEGGGFGYFDPVSGNLNTLLNEATVEVLRLSARYPKVPMRTLATALRDSPGASCYPQEVSNLMSAILITHLTDGKPYSAQDLAKVYFQARTDRLTDNSDILITQLEDASPKRYRESIKFQLLSLTT